MLGSCVLDSWLELQLHGTIVIISSLLLLLLQICWECRDLHPA